MRWASVVVVLVSLFDVVGCFRPRRYFLDSSLRTHTAINNNNDKNKNNEDLLPEASDKEDFITKIFGKFMPKPETVGLNRFDQDSLPENYPATKTEFIEEPLSSDKDQDMKLIRPLLARTNLRDRKLILAYSSKRDGFSSSSFHQKVDAKGPGVVLARTVEGVTCGGYNPCGWVDLGEARGNIAAFLFLIDENGGGKGPDNKYIKLQKIGGAGMAQVDDGGGPKFGAEGLTIPLLKAKPKVVRSKLGLYYENLPNGGRTLFGDNIMETELTEFKVYVGDWTGEERLIIVFSFCVCACCVREHSLTRFITMV